MPLSSSSNGVCEAVRLGSLFFYIFSGDILQDFAKKACVECLLGLKTVFLKRRV